MTEDCYCELCGLSGAHWLGCVHGPRPDPIIRCQVCSDIISDPDTACTSEVDGTPFEVHAECCVVCGDHDLDAG